MRNITAIAAALGFFLAASAPSFAATADTATIELAAAKKKVDCTDPKNAKNKACKAKMDKKTDLGSITFSAAKKKVDCKDPKNADNKACKSKMDKK
jgi:phosphate-selective porin